MYNVCNSGARCGCGCGCGFWNSFWNTNTQSICRDACGNIRVNQARCGCQTANTYNTCAQATTWNTCGNAQTVGGCGRCCSNLSQLNGDAYYVRLYALGNTQTTPATGGCTGTGYNGCGYGYNGCARNNGCGTCFGCCRNRCPYTWTVEDATDDT